MQYNIKTEVSRINLVTIQTNLKHFGGTTLNDFHTFKRRRTGCFFENQNTYFAHLTYLLFSLLIQDERNQKVTIVAWLSLVSGT